MIISLHVLLETQTYLEALFVMFESYNRIWRF